jgi:protein-S-isoprenylcysteine O-methyltransferase Ste14
MRPDASDVTNGPRSGLRKATLAYLLIQGAGVFAWWLMLWRVPAARAWFAAPGRGEMALLAFWLPDLVIGGGGSLLAVWLVLRDSRWAGPALWSVAGAMAYATLYCVAASMATRGGWFSVALMTPAALASTALAALNALPADRLMRPAQPGSAGRNVARTLAQCAVVWGVTLALLPALLLIVDRHFQLPRLSFAGQLSIAALTFACFSALNLWTGLTLATRGEGTPLPLESPRRLVVAGPYAWVRNPMALAGLGQGMAIALAFGSWLLVAYVVAGALVWNFALRPPEERDLLARFGAEYEHYRRWIRCWIPALRPYRAARPGGVHPSIATIDHEFSA